MSYKPQRTFLGEEGDYSVDDRGPEALKKDIDNVMDMFDPTAKHPDGTQGGISKENLNWEFSEEGMSAEIGSADIDGLDADNNVYSQLVAIVNVLLTHSNLKSNDTLAYIGGYLNSQPNDAQSIVDLLYTYVMDRYTKAAADSLVAEKTNPLIKTLTYDSDTGKLTATTAYGTVTEVFDLNIEKIPAAIGIVEEGDAIYIRITNTDGSYTQSDVTKLLTHWSFNDTDTIAAVTGETATGRTAKFNVVDASIKKSHLAAEVMQALQEYEASANTAATSAAASATSAENSSKITVEYYIKTKLLEMDAEDDAELSKSYAVGGVGSSFIKSVHPNEDTDNAKYYSEQANANYQKVQKAADNAISSISTVESNIETRIQTSFESYQELTDNSIKDIEYRMTIVEGWSKSAEESATAASEKADETVEYALKAANSASSATASATAAATSEKNAAASAQAATDAAENANLSAEAAAATESRLEDAVTAVEGFKKQLGGLWFTLNEDGSVDVNDSEVSA